MGLERVFQQPVSSNEIEVKVLTLDQEPVSVKLDRNDSLAVAKVKLIQFSSFFFILLKKVKIESTFRSKNLISIPPAQQRIIFCGQILTPETLQIKNIPNVADG